MFLVKIITIQLISITEAGIDLISSSPTLMCIYTATNIIMAIPDADINLNFEKYMLNINKIARLTLIIPIVRK